MESLHHFIELEAVAREGRGGSFVLPVCKLLPTGETETSYR